MSLAEFDEIKYDNSVERLDRPSKYLLRKARKNHANGLDDLRQSMRSSTIYVGNLSFYTSEEQIYELFSKCGVIKRIIMGLDRFKFTPCGFCFVIYNKPREALNAVKYLTETKLDDRNISIDLDPGFEDGRQFGRGKSGGQVSDELRFEYDASRGGFAVPFADRVGGATSSNSVHGSMGGPRRGRFNPHSRPKPRYVPPPDAMGSFASSSTNNDGMGGDEEDEDTYIPQ
ncbi:hypothetical protein TBLA_0A01830 [Henningerozyma blattae CBS 6284]|uniref:Nuclear cap-binding protein subunit 2 n=1 Tax=Henningerozyma blattae (strain ATCC 34711 / CBS 6284 / DSM 70876 / NBRC 10599 / NRRL Y-10934 / UCD 77-7) TaxID=1071380 RepID=I2GV32_HENB6|nr:hypothetical protein TBLA_0A01830 [Tetrapisispora blattae CBS 6284]CCH57984.1 hypothetical protein TBLA_0A01830 [Tetrapisispora blattae CBS 6284]